MRLKNIKLAGFKTFIQPATIGFRSNLCAVVGPNGCGKSNLIDAVKWVLGANTTAQLRSTSVADVIFAGAGTRAPASRANVELIFTNPDQRITGQYAEFEEISVRRLVTTDGGGSYFINNKGCRRRDIIDLFAGTGLKPNSYSIISQGLISELADAGPIQLRAYLEEAAGIGKYKEKRHETEQQIRRTKDNLERLNERLSEVTNNLSHLQQQADKVKRYQKLQAISNQLQAELLCLQWQTLNNDRTDINQQLKVAEQQLTHSQKEQSALDNQTEAKRAQQTESFEQLNAAQGKRYQLEHAATLTASDLQAKQEKLQDIRSTHKQHSEQETELATWLQQNNSALEHTTAQLQQAHKELKKAAKTKATCKERLDAATTELTEQQSKERGFQNANLATLRDLDRQQSALEHLNQNIEQHQHQINQRQAEMRAATANQQTQTSISEAEVAISKLDRLINQLLETITKTKQKHLQLTSTVEQQNTHLHQQRQKLEHLQGQQTALEDAITGAVDPSNSIANQWLKKAASKDVARLSQNLIIEPDWALAMEIVLGEFLQSLVVTSLPIFRDALAQLKSGRLLLIEADTKALKIPPKGRLEPLVNQLAKPHPAAALLTHVYTACDTETALSERHLLADGESVITPSGLWLGRQWAALPGTVAGHKSILTQTAKMQRLQTSIDEQHALINTSQQELANRRQELNGLNELRQEQTQSLLEFQTKKIRLESDWRELKTHLAMRLERDVKIAEELNLIKQQLTNDTALFVTTKKNLGQAKKQAEQQARQHALLNTKQEKARQKVAIEQVKTQQALDAKHQSELENQRLQAEQNNIKALIAQLENNHHELAQKKIALDAQATAIESSLNGLQSDLTNQNKQLASHTLTLDALHRKTKQVDTELKQLLEKKAHLDQSIEQQRSQTESLRLQDQMLGLQQQNQQKELQQINVTNPKTILAHLDTQMTEQNRTKRLAKTNQSIESLGAINMAAMEEYDEANARKTYFKNQNEDITSALTTLEAAIKRIDQETRVRFQKTLQAVNDKLQAFFIKCFGGGLARLEMTGDNLLDTGLAIIARPPGKKNKHIQVLSGGEKALTALSLIFAIFELNPVPLCMLDEVDASLDDLNTLRYINLLKEMSKNMQFVYITHNKLSIEAADQLIGVTMHDPGISSLIEVDVRSHQQKKETGVIV